MKTTVATGSQIVHRPIGTNRSIITRVRLHPSKGVCTYDAHAPRNAPR